MNRFQTFQQFLSTHSAQISMWEFAVNLLLTALLSALLARIYIRYGTSLSNRKMFANNFILISTTTMVVITIVKSSLALSLGLVGALSIVRFRAAIKEPEELSYLFLAIAIGLGFGADQRIIMIVAFCMIAGIIILRKRCHDSVDSQNLYITIASYDPKKIGLEEILKTLKKYCSAVDLKRFDETKEVLEASFLVACNTIELLQKAKLELQKLSSAIKITFLDNKGIFQ